MLYNPFTAVFRRVGTNASFQKHEQISYLDNLVCLTSHQLTNHTMPFHKISCNLILAVIRLYKHEILPLWDILDIMHLSQRTFFHILKLWHETSNVVTHKYGNLAGRLWILNFDDIYYVLQLVHLCPDWFLDELLELLKTNRFISIHYVTIYQELQRAGVSYKKLKHIASEHNKEARNDYIAHISQYEPEEVGFLDETAKNDKTATRANGHAKKGCSTTMKQCFVHGTCLLETVLLTVDGIVASTVVEGSMNREMYLEFLEYHVVSVEHLLFTQSNFDLALHCSDAPYLCLPRSFECAYHG